MSAYFFSLGLNADRSSTIEKKIKEVVPGLVRVKSFEDVRPGKPVKGEGAAYVLVAASGNTDAYFDRLLGMVEKAKDQYFFILISDEISASDYKRLIRAGSADWVSIARAPQEILEIIARRRVSSKPAASADGRPPVAIAFVPSAGGVGNTTLVAEIGTQLKGGKSGKEHRVCAVDLDFQTSHLCDYLDIEPRLQIAEISANPERLDAQLFEIFISRHSSGLDVFAAPRSKFNVCDLSAVALDKLFDMISSRYDLMLIDLPVTAFSWTADVIANCDGVLVTGLNTIPGLRQISETLITARSYGSHVRPTAVVINRSERRVLGGIARGKHIEAVLREEKVFFVSDNRAAFISSTNSGTPLSLTTSYRKSTREIAAIGAFCAGIKSPLKASS